MLAIICEIFLFGNLCLRDCELGTRVARLRDLGNERNQGWPLFGGGLCRSKSAFSVWRRGGRWVLAVTWAAAAAAVVRLASICSCIVSPLDPPPAVAYFSRIFQAASSMLP